MGTRSEKPSELEDMTCPDQPFRAICLLGSLVVEAQDGECVELRICDGSVVISRVRVQDVRLQDVPTREDAVTLP